MHLLYLDESGSAADPAQRYFVLAGVAVFERSTHWIEQKLNEIVMRFAPDDHQRLELHGSPMRSGKSAWKHFQKEERINAMREALRRGITEFYPHSARVFAAVVEKAALDGEDPVELAFEQISSRFDLFLQRCYSKHNNPQRGVMIFDRSTTEQRIQTLAREFKYSGHRWGQTRNYAEVPLFIDSRATRLIQLADLVAYAVFRQYEHGDPSFFQEIENSFDSEGGVKHGLFVTRRSNQQPLL